MTSLTPHPNMIELKPSDPETELSCPNCESHLVQILEKIESDHVYSTSTTVFSLSDWEENSDSAIYNGYCLYCKDCGLEYDLEVKEDEDGYHAKVQRILGLHKQNKQQE